MASDNQKDQRAAEREQRKGVRSPPVSAQSGPPILNDGLEMLRSRDC